MIVVTISVHSSRMELDASPGGGGVRCLCPGGDRCKHYLPATSFVGGNNVDMNILLLLTLILIFSVEYLNLELMPYLVPQAVAKHREYFLNNFTYQF